MTDQKQTPLDVAQFLPGWIARQRWYIATGERPALTYAGHLSFKDPQDQVGIAVLILRDTAGPTPLTYQVPLTYRSAPVPDLDHALIAAGDHDAPTPQWIYDGPHDLAYVRALYAAIEDGTSSDHEHDQYAHAQGHPTAEDPHVHGPGRTIESAAVLRGEQSNTSIIIEATGPDQQPAPVIVKVFRILHSGSNPDVELQSALSASGCGYVPAAAGYLAGSWPGPDGSTARGHLAFAQEFLPGTHDAWRVATADLATGAGAETSFRARAQDLGAATAAVHLALARAFPTAQADDVRRAALVASWQRRWQLATTDAPQIAGLADAVHAVFDRAAGAAWPPLQRVHGDYHLGQVLDVPNRGWVLLDFEGEPLRPLDERNDLDLAARDVAGMLRSFDYAAGARTLAEPGQGKQAAAWAQACRSAFLAGYARVAGDPRGTRDGAALVDALELDKALYEVSYEARFRPHWSTIPLAAVSRLVGIPPFAPDRTAPCN